MVLLWIGVIISLIGIVWGANNLVDGSVAVARRYRVSEFIVGALIIGVGTSMPEFLVSLSGVWKSNPDIAIGNVVGSNIFNILGILGLVALLKPIPIKFENTKFDLLWCLGVSLYIYFSVQDNPTHTLISSCGWILTVSFIIYILLSFLNAEPDKALPSTYIPRKSVWKNTFQIIGGLLVLIISCDYFVNCGLQLAKNFGVSDSVVALTLLAWGTSLPELAASLAAIFKKTPQLALGNIVGSNIFNISLILGVCSQITPLTTTNIGTVDYLVMVGAVLLLIICSLVGRIGRVGGALMLLSLAGYTLYLLGGI